MLLLPRRLSEHAFTLFEAMLTLAIVSIMMMAAASYSSLQNKTEQRLAADTLIKTLQFARVLALQHQQAVTVCGSADQRHCDGDWQSGLLVRWTGSGNTMVHYYPWTFKKIRVHYRGFVHEDSLLYLQNGLTEDNGQFRLSSLRLGTPSDDDPIISISRSGRIRQSAGQK